MSGAPLVAARFLHFLSCMIVFGTSAFCFALEYPRGIKRGQAAPQFRTLLRASAALALISTLLWFLCVVVGMTGEWRDALHGPALETVLLQTQFGHVWQWRSLLVLALFLAVFRAAQSPDLLVLLLSLVVLESLALTGHAAMGTGTNGMAHQIADAVHLLAGGF